MFRSLIDAFRSELQEDDASGTANADRPEPDETHNPAPNGQATKRSKHDRAAEKIGFLLSTPLGNMSRKKMMKMVPHLLHHFEKGFGKGDGDYGVVDPNDLMTLGRHAKHISQQAHGMKRMPGAAHHLAAHLMKHVANAHERMAKAAKYDDQEEAADLHDTEHKKYRELQKQHKMIARRHGIYDESY